MVNEEGEGAQVVPREPPGQLAQLAHDGRLEGVLDLRGRPGLAAASAALVGALAADRRRLADLGGLRGRGVGVSLGHLEEVLESQKTLKSHEHECMTRRHLLSKARV